MTRGSGTAPRPLAPDAPAGTPRGFSLGARVAAAAIAVAVLDYLYVYVLWVVIRQRTSAVRLLHSIAAGLLGRNAFSGGAPAAWLGAGLHLTIALGWTLVYLVAIRRIAALRRVAATGAGRGVLGLLFGGFVWLAMFFVVVPLSATRMAPEGAGLFLLNLVEQAIVVGLPIAFLIGQGKTPAARA